MPYDLVRYDSIYNKDVLTPVSLEWTQCVELFTTHLVMGAKDHTPGFGPYSVRAPLTPCTTHPDGKSRVQPHRCDSSVRALTLAVFDADEGSPQDLDTTRGLIASAGLAQVWYTTHSYRPDQAKPSWRLVLPLATPVHPSRWKKTRETLLTRFRIPALPGKCSGASHFYYLPSHPPGVVPLTFVAPGQALDLGADVAKPALRSEVAVEVEAWDPDEELPNGYDLEPIRTALRKRVASLKRAQELEKAERLRTILDGKPFPDGRRREDSFRVCGMLAWACPEVPLAALAHLLRPTYEAMAREGSSVTWAYLTNALTSGRKRYLEDQARLAAFDEERKVVAAEEKRASNAWRVRKGLPPLP